MTKYVYDDLRHEPEKHILKTTQRFFNKIMALPDKGRGKEIFITSNKYEVGQILSYQKDTKMHIVFIDGNLQRLNLLNWDVKELTHDDLDLFYLRRRPSAEKGTIKLYDSLMQKKDKGVGDNIIITSKIEGESSSDVGCILHYDEENDMFFIQIGSSVQRLYFYNWKIRDLSFVKNKIKSTIKFYLNYMKELFELKNNDFSWLKNKEILDSNIKIVSEKLESIGTIFKYKEDIGIENNLNSPLSQCIYILMSIYEVLTEDFSIFEIDEFKNVEDSKSNLKQICEVDFNHKIVNAIRKIKKLSPIQKKEKILYLAENDPFFDSYFTLSKSQSTTKIEDYIDKDGKKRYDLSGKSFVKAIKRDNKTLGDFIDLKNDLDFKIWNPSKSWNPSKKRKLTA